MKKTRSLSTLEKIVTDNVLKNRHDKGLSQVDLAVCLNVSRSRIAAVESGRSSYSIRNIELLAILFGCSADELFRK